MQKHTASITQIVTHKRGISEIKVSVITNTEANGLAISNTDLTSTINSAISLIGATLEPISDSVSEPDQKKAKTSETSQPSSSELLSKLPFGLTPELPSEPVSPAVPSIKRFDKSSYETIL